MTVETFTAKDASVHRGQSLLTNTLRDSSMCGSVVKTDGKRCTLKAEVLSGVQDAQGK
jgi:hypothetical protein